MDKRYNYKLTISYIGTNYHGWQKQKNAITIQEIIENLLIDLFKEKITLIGAGRTDAGVHALGQVANFKTIIYKEPKLLYKYLNAKLPRDISILKVEEVDINFNARFSAKGKTYIYKIYTKPNPFLYGLAWYIDKPLDIKKMVDGLNLLKNYKDFTSLAKKENYLRKEIDLREVYLHYDGEIITITITASHFLRNLVRRIVGHIVKIGTKELTIEEFKKIIEAKDPSKGRFIAPACGLYLKEIYY